MTTTREDLQAIADLVKEHFGYARRVATVGRITTRQGHAHYNTGHISVPQWAIDKGEAYAIYYVIHEVCHLVNYWKNGPEAESHGYAFKHFEGRALELFDITIDYARAYPKRLYLNGQKFYDNTGHTEE